MPSKNTIKVYADDSFYHAYNRGVEKRKIFLDEQDFATFLSYIKLYLSPPNPHENLRIKKSFHEHISLHSFCLMPNHYHLLIKQQESNAMAEFIRALSTSYSMYFNKKYERIGSLFQGRYKAALVDNDAYILALTRYIHRNPLDLGLSRTDLAQYSYSSYPYYLGERNSSWVEKNFILSYFNKEYSALSYKEFVESGDDTNVPDNLLIDE